MALTDTLNKNVMGFGTLGIVIVIVSVVLLKFKDTVGPTLCTASNGIAGNLTTYNSSSDLCCFTNTSGSFCGVQSATPNVISDIGTFVSALSEPKNWVAIVIIALIGFAVLKIFTSKQGK